MGYTTRVDVQLRGVWGPPRPEGVDRRTRSGAQPESFTDLDVLGLGFFGGSRLHSAIIDCKTSQSGSTGRMFWVRGVADLFAADDAYMVRSSVVSDAARQLATRLGIVALTSEDLTRIETLHPSDLPLDTGPLSRLFEEKSVAQVLSSLTGLDRKLAPLLDFRNYGYWLNDEHRNLVQLVAYLRDSATLLDARNPRHLSLVLDLSWLYLVSLSQAIHAIRTAHVSNPDRGLQEYLSGGAAGLREKQQLARLLTNLRDSGGIPAEVNVDSLPPYYPKLRELVVRVMRRPDRVLAALRLLEVLVSVTALGERVEPTELDGLHDELSAKLTADVVGFLVAATGLDSGFRDRARSLMLGEPVPETTS